MVLYFFEYIQEFIESDWDLKLSGRPEGFNKRKNMNFMNLTSKMSNTYNEIISRDLFDNIFNKYFKES